MSWSHWFDGGENLPVLQAVFPDKQNRFPEEPGFDERYRQPLLQPDAPLTGVEKDFWASTDPKSSLFDWRFTEPPHTQVFLSKTVESGSEPVVYVFHSNDGSWQFWATA